jgi:hypothetical protein
MDKFAIALAFSLLAASAQAQTRPSTVNMPCGASRQLVFTRGAIVLGTGGFTYDRFVRDQTFCDVTEYASAAYGPSIETPVCFVGYRCKQGPRELWDD